MTVDGSVRGRGRLRLMWASVVNRNMNLFIFTNQMAFDRIEWRRGFI